MINTYDTRDNPPQLTQEKVIAIMDHYYHPARDTQSALIGNPMLSLYQYLKQTADMLQSSIIAETDNNYKLHLIGRLYELMHVIYVMDKPEAIMDRIEQSAAVNI